MSKKVKLLWSIFICIFFCTLNTGCLIGRETDELVYVMAMGIDKGKKDTLLVTFQIANAQAIAGGNSGGGGEPFKVASVEGPNFFACMNIINATTGRILTLSHCRIIIFGEELAQESIYAYLLSLRRFREVRSTSYIAIAENTAKDVLEKTSSSQESPGKYYDLKVMVAENTGLSKTQTVKDFYDDLKSASVDPFTVLMGSTDKKKTQAKEAPPPENFGAFLPGEIPRAGELPIDAIGTAVFRKDKMAGRLNGDETKTLLLLNGDFKRGFFTLPDPRHPGLFVVLRITQGKRPEIEVDLANGTIRQDLYLEGEFYSIQSGENYESIPLKKEIEAKFSNLIQQKSLQLLNKLQQDYQADAVGYGQYAKHHFLTTPEWEAANWRTELYPEMNLEVQVHTKIRRTGLMLETTQIPEN